MIIDAIVCDICWRSEKRSGVFDRWGSLRLKQRSHRTAESDRQRFVICDVCIDEMTGKSKENIS